MYAIHKLAKTLGGQKCKAILFFHALTSSDTTRFFKGIGIKKAWEVWNVMPEITPIFAQLGSNGVNRTISARDFKYLKGFVRVMYKKISSHVKVNETRHAMIADEGLAIEHIPSTEGALVQKAQRALFQSIIWHKPSTQNFGWKKVNGKWKPHWPGLPVVVNSLRKLISSGCKKRCTGNCKCI